MRSMIFRGPAALTLVLLCAGNLLADGLGVVSDDFGNPNGGFTKYEVPNPALRSADTGFRWTGYGVTTFYAFLNSGGATLIDSRVNGNTTGSYTYTIFDSSGGNSPDKNVFKLQDVTVQWSGVGTDGTSTAKIIIRDASGDWFLSDLTIDVLSNTAQTLDVNATTWQSLAGTLSTLDDVTDDDTGALTIGPTAIPDLTAVTGGGYYIASDTFTTATRISRAESITFAGVPEPGTITLLLSGSLMAVIIALRRHRAA